MVEWDLGLRLLNLGEERHEGLDQVEKSYCKHIAHVLAISTSAIDRAASCWAMLAMVAGRREWSSELRHRDGTKGDLRLLMMGDVYLEINSSRESFRRKRKKKSSDKTARRENGMLTNVWERGELERRGSGVLVR